MESEAQKSLSRAQISESRLIHRQMYRFIVIPLVDKLRNILDGRTAKRRLSVGIFHQFPLRVATWQVAIAGLAPATAQFAHRDGHGVLVVRRGTVRTLGLFDLTDMVDADVGLGHVWPSGHEVVEQLSLQAGVAWQALQPAEFRIGIVAAAGCGELGHESEVFRGGVLQQGGADGLDELCELVFQLQHSIRQLWFQMTKAKQKIKSRML